MFEQNNIMVYSIRLNRCLSVYEPGRSLFVIGVSHMATLFTLLNHLECWFNSVYFLFQLHLCLKRYSIYRITFEQRFSVWEDAAFIGEKDCYFLYQQQNMYEIYSALKTELIKQNSFSATFAKQNQFKRYC